MLDLAKFSKTKEDKNTVTMRHDDGHEMTILLTALPKIQREQLKRLKMAKGGMAHYDDGTPDAPVSSSDAQPDSSASSNSSDSSDSTPDHSTNITINTSGLQSQPGPAANPTPQNTGDGYYRRNDGTTYDTPARAPAQETPASMPVTPGTTPVAPAQPITQVQGKGQLVNNPESSPTNAATELAQASNGVQVPEVSAALPNLNPSGTMNPAAVAKNVQGAAQAQGQIDSAKGHGIANLEQNYIDAAGQTAQMDQQNLANIKGHVNDFAQYIQDHPIDPNHYAQSASTGQKVANAIGLLAGGFTGGFNGTGNNPAYNYINSQIDRDISAQKDRMGQQKTIYDAYHQIYGDSVATNAATKASMLDIYTHKANQIAARLATPQAQQAAMAFSANAAIEKSRLLQEAAVSLRSLPGYAPTGQQGAPGSGPTQMGGIAAPRGGASGSWGDSNGQNTSDNLLKPGAMSQYQWSLSKYNKVQTPEEKARIQQEYSNGQQADKSVAAIKQLWPEMLQNRNLSGYLSEKVHPNELGIAGGALGAGIGAYVSGGTGAGAGAGLGAGAGEALGVGAKNALGAMGGDQQIKYETARNALVTQIGAALGEGVTPTDKAEIAREFAPNWWDSEETAKNKLEKLIQKIKLVTRTPTLDESKLTNR
jgi:hypothetical protein